MQEFKNDKKIFTIMFTKNINKKNLIGLNFK